MAKHHDQKALAKKLFFQHQTAKEIALAVDAAMPTIYQWAREWRPERDAQMQHLAGEIKEEAKNKVLETVDTGLDIIRDAFKAKAASGTPATIQEAKAISDIVVQFDKLLRLDAGEATEIIEERDMKSIEDLKAAVLEDPFLLIKEVKSESRPRGKDAGSGEADQRDVDNDLQTGRKGGSST